MNVPPHLIPGGRAFLNHMVDDIVMWAHSVASPAFIVTTEWSSDMVGDTHVSMVIQYDNCPPAAPTNDPSRATADDIVPPPRWALSSIPLRSVPPPPAADPPVIVRRKNIDIRDPKKCTFFVHSDQEMVEVLRAAFELELWSSGSGAPAEFEAVPKLYMVDHRGFLVRIRCNGYGALAGTLGEWCGMMHSMLKIIRILSASSPPLTTTTNGNGKRPRIDVVV